MIEARALKNRFNSNTIGKLLQVYRTYLLNDKLDQYESIVKDSLQNLKRTSNLMSILSQIVEQENQFLHFDSVVEYAKNNDGSISGYVK